MVIRHLVAGSLTWRGSRRMRLRCAPVSRWSRLGALGLLVAVAFAGCSSNPATTSPANSTPTPAPSGSPGPTATATPTPPPAASPAPTPNASPTPVPTFVKTGSMKTPRQNHTATLLSDGRVLIAGGVKGSTALVSAEIYDPKTGTFSSTGSMVGPTSIFTISKTATLLSDGRVLIVGDNAAEIYDPNKGTFRLTSSPSGGGQFHSATLLEDGRVLIAGGMGDASHRYLASAELFDPKTGKFSKTGTMNAVRGAHTATLLSDGRVLIAGLDMSQVPGQKTLNAELYDPGTGTFSPIDSDSRVAFALHTATLLSNGQVLLLGNQEAELFDPATSSFTATGSLTTAQEPHTATLLADGRVLVAGGLNGEPLASAQLYDPATGAFSDAAAMTTARSGQTATLLADGRVLIAGGINYRSAGNCDAESGAELFQP